jgi:MFS family permease
VPSAAVAAVAASSSHEVRRAVAATYVAFGGAGFAFASWASRIPQVREHLQLSPARLGVVLLAIAAGSLVALPLAGPVVHRLGTRRTVAAMAVLMTVSQATIALGYLAGLAPVVVGLFLLGFSNGA